MGGAAAARDPLPASSGLHTVHKTFNKALQACGLATKGLNLYRSTKHTMGAWWIRDGGKIEALKKVLGHASVTTTERYAILRDLAMGDLSRMGVDLSQPAGPVLELPPHRDKQAGTIDRGLTASSESETGPKDVSTEN